MTTYEEHKQKRKFNVEIKVATTEQAKIEYYNHMLDIVEGCIHNHMRNGQHSVLIPVKGYCKEPWHHEIWDDVLKSVVASNPAYTTHDNGDGTTTISW